MPKHLKRKDGVKVDITPWLAQMKDNLAKKRDDIFERTPIMVKADRTYCWVEDDTTIDGFHDLTTRSVRQLINHLSRG